MSRTANNFTRRRGFIWALIGLASALVLALILVDQPRSLLQTTEIACPVATTGDLAWQVTVPDGFKCERRGFWREVFVRAPTGQPKREDASLVGVRIVTGDTGLVATLRFQAYTDSLGPLVVQDGGKTVAQSFAEISAWCSNALTHFQIPVTAAGQIIAITKANIDGQALVSWPELVVGAEESTPVVAKDAWRGSFWFMGLAVLLLLMAGYQAVRGGWGQWRLVLLLALFVLTLVLGSPFAAQVGFIDAGDDTSYVSWAHALGYNLDGDLTRLTIDSWAKGDNHHSWGTGLLLAPFLYLQALVAPHWIGWNHVSLSTLAFAAGLLGVLSVVWLYGAFARLWPPWLAALLACGLLCGTSLLKWTYLRSVFSHAPEMFCLCAFGCGLLRMYGSEDSQKRQGRWLTAATALAFFLLVQVRREDLMFVVFPLWLGWFKSNGSGRQRLLSVAFWGAVGLISLLVLQATNLLTNAPGFWYSPTAHLLGKGVNWLIFTERLHTVLLGPDGGLLLWWQGPTYLALLAFILGWRHWRLSAPAAIVVIATILMCALHVYPTGYEWQNRFALKLSPLFLWGSGWLIANSMRRAWLVALLVGYLLVGFLWQMFGLYPDVWPEGVPRYFELYTDYQILNPQDLSPSRLPMMLLPLVLLAIVISEFLRLLLGGATLKAPVVQATWLLKAAVVIVGLGFLGYQGARLGVKGQDRLAAVGLKRQFDLVRDHRQLLLSGVPPQVLSCGEDGLLVAAARLRNLSPYVITSGLGARLSGQPVNLAVQFLDSSGAIVGESPRIKLPRNLQPQFFAVADEVEVAIAVPCPTSAAAMAMQLDLVQEGVRWLRHVEGHQVLPRWHLSNVKPAIAVRPGGALKLQEGDQSGAKHPE